MGKVNRNISVEETRQIVVDLTAAAESEGRQPTLAEVTAVLAKRGDGEAPQHLRRVWFDVRAGRETTGASAATA